MDREDVIWRALADPTRRHILDLLRRQPRTTGELVAAISDMTRFGVMKHLSVLEEAGLVVVRKRGKYRWNFLNPVPIRRIYERWMQPMAEAPAVSLLKLEEFLEREKGSRGG